MQIIYKYDLVMKDLNRKLEDRNFEVFFTASPNEQRKFILSYI